MYVVTTKMDSWVLATHKRGLPSLSWSHYRRKMSTDFSPAAITHGCCLTNSFRCVPTIGTLHHSRERRRSRSRLRGLMGESYCLRTRQRKVGNVKLKLKFRPKWRHNASESSSSLSWHRVKLKMILSKRRFNNTQRAFSVLISSTR